jgi:hypothetical protein
MSTEKKTASQELEEVSLELINKRVDLSKHRHELFYPWGILFIIMFLLLVLGIVGTTFWGQGWVGLVILVVIAGVFLLAAFGTAGGFTHTFETFELQRDVAGLTLKQKLLKEYRPQQLPPQEHYRQVEVPQVIAQYQREAKTNRRIDLFFQLTIIIASLLVTGFTSGLDLKLNIHILWVAPVLSLIVSFCTAITGFFKFRQRSFNLQQTADSIAQEKTAVTLGIRVYENKTPQEALVLFAKRVLQR